MAMASPPRSNQSPAFAFALLVLLRLAVLSSAQSDSIDSVFGPATARTTRYWDCCKPSCSWKNKAPFSNPIQSCDIDSKPLLDDTRGTGCNGGNAFACPSNSPWAVNDTFSYGFVGTFLVGGDESKWCCSCYHLNFTSGPAKGKSMIVQSSNTIYDDPTENFFTLGIPGGNTSYAGACGLQFSVPNSIFGPEKVGLTTRAACDDLPEPLKPGCYWRFDWFLDSTDPNVEYKRVKCPAELTNITTCVRDDDDTFQDKKSQSPSLSTSLPSMTSTAVFAIFVGWMLQLLG